RSAATPANVWLAVPTSETRRMGRRTRSLSIGRASRSLTTATITGVIAEAITVPPFQTWETTIAATADETAARMSVWSETPSRFCLLLSEATVSRVARRVVPSRRSWGSGGWRGAQVQGSKRRRGGCGRRHARELRRLERREECLDRGLRTAVRAGHHHSHEPRLRIERHDPHPLHVLGRGRLAAARLVRRPGPRGVPHSARHRS